MNSEDVVDLFEEEVNKKQLKEEKKIARKVNKEKKRQKKKDKILDKEEDLMFAKKLEEKNIEDVVLIEDKKDNLINDMLKDNNCKVIKKYKFLNFILTISIIGLLIASIDYTIYNVIKEKDLEIILNSLALCLLSIFYILSIIIKKQGIKKFFQILATLSLAAYMLYQLYII